VIDKLELFLALARARHFGRAAEEVGVSQPTLSAGVKQLEEMLGVPLVVRGSRFQGFTAEGERLLEWSRRLVGDWRSMRQDIEALRKTVCGHFRLAAVPTALAMVPKLTIAVIDKHPGVDFLILASNSQQIIEQVENLAIDAGLTYLDNEPVGNFVQIPLYRERYHLITGPASDFSGRTEVRWAELQDVPLCLLSPDMQNRRIIDRALHQVGVTAEVAVESNSMTALAAHVRTGRWTSIMPTVLMEALGLPAELEAIPLVDPVIEHTIGLVMMNRDPQSPMAAAMIAAAMGLQAMGSAD